MLNGIYVTQDEKFNFVKGLIRISKSDGNIGEDEIAFMKGVAAGMGLTEENIKLLQDSAEYDLASEQGKEFFKLQFATKYQGLFFLREAVQLCHIDGVYHDNEKEAIKNITQELNISLSTLKEIEDWVVEGMLWRAKGDLLLSME